MSDSPTIPLPANSPQPATMPAPEREQTDESLRIEREKADQAIEDELSAIDETADAVISRARRRADKVLAAARVRMDRQLAGSARHVEAPGIVRQERTLEDQAVQRERDTADAAIQTERAEYAGLLSTERNETDRDLSSERARADGMLATRDEFLGTVSHDLRQMLNIVVGFAALIEKGVSRDAASTVTYAQRIQRAGARMDRLIGDLVDVASIEAGALHVTREVGDLGQVVAEAVETFQPQASAHHISLAADIQPLPPVAFDPARMLQVLTNLLSNAIKFTATGGAVTVRAAVAGTEVRVAVHDTGAGIPADQLEAIFERFLQVAPDRRGVGLGLYISRCIVQGHGGKIWAESRPGEGSTFFLTLPLE